MGTWIVMLVALLFIVLFGGLTLLRKEPLSLRFVLEVLGLTALAYIVYWATRYLASPIVFLLILYVVTMRAQILIDLGTFLARRGEYRTARRAYEASQRLGVGGYATNVARINIGTCYLKEKRLDEALGLLSSIAAEADKGNMPPKDEAACRYNLGLALMRSGKTAEAVRQLNRVEELLPASIYGIGAKAELKRYRETAAGGDSRPGAQDSDADKPKQEA